MVTIRDTYPDPPDERDVQAMREAHIVQLAPGKSDTEVAAEFKERIVKASEELLRVFAEIDRAGFGSTVSFGKNGLGQYAITALGIVKPF
jgi:hypothetical protein